MKTRLYDHIDLRVRDLKLATPFYGEVLPALGFTDRRGNAESLSFYAPGKGKTPFFDLTEDRDHRPNANRISFWADTREEVDRVAEVVKRAGGKVLEGPELCVDYTPDYYAFFWEDLDGNRFEICCRTEPK